MAEIISREFEQEVFAAPANKQAPRAGAVL